MTGWALVPNPAYAGQKPHLLDVSCHDGTPFMTLECGCGEKLHLHESQLDPVRADAEIATRCHGCDELLIFPPGVLQDGFARLRAAGWIA